MSLHTLKQQLGELLQHGTEFVLLRLSDYVCRLEQLERGFGFSAPQQSDFVETLGPRAIGSTCHFDKTVCHSYDGALHLASYESRSTLRNEFSDDSLQVQQDLKWLVFLMGEKALEVEGDGFAHAWR